jgi:hypothetical protein
MPQEQLWIDPSGRWEIARHENGRIMTIDNERDVNDWPIDYGEQSWTHKRIGYDYPEWFPEYVKDATEIVMTQEDGDLKEIRLQLCYALAFMWQTDDGKHDGLWWAGKMPGYPTEYDPEEWNDDNWYMEKIWDEFLADLKDAGLYERYWQARDLPIADLLAIGNPYNI